MAYNFGGISKKSEYNFEGITQKQNYNFGGIAEADFDPEGEGYDYATARKHGIKPDKTGHWPSRVPQTGQILKGQKHPTYHKTVAGEKEAGYDIFKGKGGLYYSQEPYELDPTTPKRLDETGFDLNDPQTILDEKFVNKDDPSYVKFKARRDTIDMLRKSPVANEFRMLAFSHGVLPYGQKDIPKHLDEAFPMETLAGELAGLATLAKVTGPIAPYVSGAKAFNILPKFQSVARMAGGRMAQTSATFGLKEFAGQMSQLIGGDEKTAQEVFGEPAKAAGFGAGLGAVGSIASPFLRIPSEAMYGFMVAKIEGADNAQAGLTAGLFGLFGLLNRANLTQAYKNAARAGAYKATVERSVKEGLSPKEAKVRADKIFTHVDAKAKEQKDALTRKDYEALETAVRREYEVSIPGKKVARPGEVPPKAPPVEKLPPKVAPKAAPEKPEVKEFLSKGYPVLVGKPKIKAESKFGLNPGDRVSRIGKVNKFGNVTSTHRIDPFAEPVVYEGIVEHEGNKWMSFLYPSQQEGKDIHLIYQISEVKGEPPELLLPNKTKGEIRIFRADFLKAGPVADQKALPAPTPEFVPEDVSAIEREIDAFEAGTRTFTRNEEGDIVEISGVPPSYDMNPDHAWMKGLGINRKRDLNIMRKISEGKKLVATQIERARELIESRKAYYAEQEVAEEYDFAGQTPSGTAFAGVPRSGGYQPQVQEEWTVENLHEKLGGLKYVKAIKVPELVKLAKALSGKLPTLKSFKRASGMFYHVGRGLIKLHPNIFKDPQLVAGILAHEIGHNFDWLDDLTMARGNILGRIAALRDFRKHFLPEKPGAPGPLTEEDKKRLMNEARRLHEKSLGQLDAFEKPEDHFDPEVVLGIWNSIEKDPKYEDLYEYISRINTEQKKSIIRQAMEARKKGIMLQIAEVKKLNKDYKRDPEAIKKMYDDLIRAEIKKRKLYEESVIRQELEALTTWWHPFNPSRVPASYLKYRYSGVELYAEFISVLLNAPVMAKQIAPGMYKAFFSYIGNKPGVLEQFMKVQDLIQGDDAKLLEQRDKDIREMFKHGDQAARVMRMQREAKRKSMWFLLKWAFVDKNIAALDARDKILRTRKLNPEDDPRYLLEEYNMVGSVVKSHIDGFEPIYKEMQDQGLTEDVDLYMFLDRVTGDRGDLANPLGHNPESAKKQMDYVREAFPEKYKKVENLVLRIRDWFKEIVDMMGDIYTPAQMEMANTNEKYAPFRVVKYMKEYISAGIIPQVGTFEDIGSPSTALVMKAVSMIRAAVRNDVKKKVGNTFTDNLELFPDMEVAKVTSYPGVFKVDIPKNKSLKPVIWRENGKWRGLHVDPYIADSFEHDTSGVLSTVGNVIGKVLLNQHLFRPLYITFNIGFQAWNFQRDFWRFWKNTPDMSFLRAVRRYIEVLPASIRRNMGKYDPLIQEMERNKALNITYNDVILGQTTEDKEIENIMSSFGFDGSINKQGMIRKIFWPILKVFEGIKFVGDIIETIPKVAGWKEMSNLPMEERAHHVRNYVGTPNFKRRGMMYAVYNNLFLFSNIIKEGIRGDYEIAFKNPRTRSGYWWKTAKLSLLPKLIMFAVTAGLLNRFLGEEYQDAMNSATEYDKTNYTIIPIGWHFDGEILPLKTPRDKRPLEAEAIYLRLPQDEMGRIYGAFLWKTLTAREDPTTTAQEVFSFTGEQIPFAGNVAPLLGIIGNWADLGKGRMPRDEYRGRDILTRDELEAGGMEAIIPMVKWTINQSGQIRLDIHDRYRDESMFSKIVQTTPILNRFIRVTNYGKTELLRKATLDTRRDESKARLATGEAITEAAQKGKSLDQLLDQVQPTSKREVSAIHKKFEKTMAKGKSDYIVNALSGATTNLQKFAVLRQARSDFANDEAFDGYLGKLVERKVISVDLAGAVSDKTLSREEYQKDRESR